MRLESIWNVAAAVILCLLNMVYLQKETVRQEHSWGGRIKALFPRERRKQIFCISMWLSCMGLAVYLESMEAYYSPLFHMKCLAVVILLWPVAWEDYRRHVIPNQLLIAGMIFRALLLPIEIFREGMEALWAIGIEIAVAAAILVFFALILLVMKNSVGMGDVKLFLVMALYMNMQVLQAVMASFLAAFLAAVFLLISKKKGRKDEIPFGPAVLAGTYIAVLFTCV